jgi:septal ring factor EnvC (AmiA/AmiB activator)
MPEKHSNQPQPTNFTAPPLAPGVPQEIGNILRASKLTNAQIKEVEAFISKKAYEISSSDDRISMLYQEVQDLKEQTLKRDQQIKDNDRRIRENESRIDDIHSDLAKLEEKYGLSTELLGMVTRIMHEDEDVLKTTKKA